MNIEEKYPSLNYFLTSYFHQDFDVLFGGADETIAAYRVTETTEEQSKMKTEIENLIVLALPEEKLQDILLNKMDCSYLLP
ncbi:contact-dependent growth inhibition system immunity protein [Pantoea sp. GCM10028869]|uniref:contact-dependent growth inhibition system immunity protein n=1 Tax=Pantoea sp. GCM10028869 TaxID=3273417 RepID=UPI00360FABD4